MSIVWNYLAKSRSRKWRKRRGAVLVIFAIVLIALLAMLGLVIDWALLASTYRQAQNAADAAALAAARDQLAGRSVGDATATATSFVQTYNGLSNAPAPTVNIPPATGLYAGKSGYVEVIVTVPLKTFLVHVVGVAPDQQVQARAVAGYEARSAGEGIAVLDPAAFPGIDVSGGGTVLVKGTITVNSEGGGVDENNQPINNGNSGFAARGGQPNSSTGVFATDIQVVGGVDSPANFKPIDPADPSPLHCGAFPGVDALLFLPTPMISTGVDSRRRGAISVANSNVKGIDSDTAGQNFVAVGGEFVGNGHIAAAGEVILHPGIYDSISITGGNTYLIPGIYVLSPPTNISNTFQINGGTIIALQVMFYNTASSYNPADGSPDVNDGSDPSPLGNAEFSGQFSMNASVTFSPIDTSKVNYASLYSGASRLLEVRRHVVFPAPAEPGDGVYRGK